MRLKKLIFDYDVIVTSRTPLGLPPNRAKFDVSTPSSFGGVKTDTQTNRIALYSQGTLTGSIYDLWTLFSQNVLVLLPIGQ